MEYNEAGMVWLKNLSKARMKSTGQIKMLNKYVLPFLIKMMGKSKFQRKEKFTTITLTDVTDFKRPFDFFYCVNII